MAHAKRVVVQFTGLEIKPRDAAQPEVFDFAPRQIDLLALDGGGSEVLLADELLPAGDYEWIRVKVNADWRNNDRTLDELGVPRTARRPAKRRIGH